MGVYLALLRGINVGGHKKIIMADLKILCEELGFEAVQTYIQSGNVIFQAEETEAKRLEAQLQTGIQQRFGFEVTVLVRTLAEWQTIVAENPFTGRDEKGIQVTLLADIPSEEQLQKLAAQTTQDEFILTGQTVYIYCHNGYGQTDLANPFWEKTLKLSATTRNWNTVTKLLKLAAP